MAWIEELDERQASGRLTDIYRELVEKRGKVANILKVHSLNPDALKTHLDLYMALMFGRSGLSRAEREAIAVVVSASNDCDYCVNHHAASLGRYEKDPVKLAAIRAADSFAPLPERSAVMLKHAARLTRRPSSIEPADLDALRNQGFSDRDILDITLVTAYFNFVNRIALGLGVEYDEEELSGYKT